jgi:hypothetical protein
MENIRDQMKAKDDTEWKLIEGRVRVMDARRSRLRRRWHGKNARRPGGQGGPGGPGGDNADGAAGAAVASVVSANRVPNKQPWTKPLIPMRRRMN